MYGFYSFPLIHLLSEPHSFVLSTTTRLDLRLAHPPFHCAAVALSSGVKQLDFEGDHSFAFSI